MTQKSNSVDKFSKSDNEINEIIGDLKKLIVDDKKCISYTYVSQRFGLHVSQAIKVLDRLSTEERPTDGQWCVNFVVSGNNDDNEDISELKMERIMIVKESDIESTTEWFKKGFDKHIYSISLSEELDQIPLSFDEFDAEVKNKDDLNKVQCLTFTKNPKISFRTVRRRTAIKPTIKNESKDSEDKTKSESKVKTKNNSNSNKGKNKKNKTSNIFGNKKEAKVEEKECDDPFKSDSEDDVRRVGDDKTVSDEEDNEAIVEKEVENESKSNDKRKRTSRKDSGSSDEEEIIVTKKKPKKYRRVRIISESDESEEEEEAKSKPKAIEKFVSENKKEKQKPFTKLEERQETHVDEDGYVVTKTVKKEVEVNQSKSAEEEKSEPKTKAKKEVKEEKGDQNAKKSADKKPEKKPKVVKDSGKKTQSSITSFFKPKQIST